MLALIDQRMSDHKALTAANTSVKNIDTHQQIRYLLIDGA